MARITIESDRDIDEITIKFSKSSDTNKVVTESSEPKDLSDSRERSIYDRSSRLNENIKSTRPTSDHTDSEPLHIPSTSDREPSVSDDIHRAY